MTEEAQNLASRLREAAQSSLPEVSVVLYGSNDSLPKREEIKRRIEDESNDLSIYTLDEMEFPEGIVLGELRYARDAVANIFLIDPDWNSHGPFHEITQLIEFKRTLSTMVVIVPDRGEPDAQYTLQVGWNYLQIIPLQCHPYPIGAWENCTEITRICTREIRIRRTQQMFFPDRGSLPPPPPA